MPMLGSPPDNLAAVSLIRAAIADDPDSGILIMSQHGGCIPGSEGMTAAAFMMALAGVSARALLSAHGSADGNPRSFASACSAQPAASPAAAAASA